MKKVLLVFSISTLAFGCQKKQDNPQPNESQQIIQESSVIDTTQGKVKVTVWSNRFPFYYRRRHVYSFTPIKILWKVDTIRSNSKVFYEEFYDKEDGGINHLEYVNQVTHYVSYIKGDSSRITAEYNGKKTTSLNLQGQTFAVVYFKNLR